MNCKNCGNILNKDEQFCTNCGEYYPTDKKVSTSTMRKRFSKNIFTFYLNDEYENKWWHRLTKVLIYGSTIVIFIFSVIFFANDIWAWSIPNSKYIYSFEKNLLAL